ncbi:uncharacterized protein LOC128338750 [Hemicordylus capensis]|uniref:uncharacterized protein LOC128338750 n=1 Tax=Hemicordylus capensis TaxID=884348 RepID=UPI0023043E84|nr:uncharacterized protein LOC128338750 [Hemicordylus capensis]
MSLICSQTACAEKGAETLFVPHTSAAGRCRSRARPNQRRLVADKERETAPPSLLLGRRRDQPSQTSTLHNPSLQSIFCILAAGGRGKGQPAPVSPLPGETFPSLACLLASMSPGPNEADPGVPHMDPAILIFLLYLMILHELVSGWMEYQKQATKPKKPPGPLWSSRTSSRMKHSGFPQPLAHPARRERYRDWRKPGRILRKV